MLNNDMYDLRVLTGNEVKEMKTSLFNTRQELEFEIKDKRAEIGELK